ncbi:MAG: two-component system, NtrC family, sensor kinase [Pseudomonadota bacterium]|nr:two-component system, NtrC family, sensor kinase [Pseudomonadota bacterium]
MRTGSSAGDSVWLEFSDNGSGIPEEIQARIFDPFFTTKPVGKGTGLGLSLSYGIIQKHNGTISVMSKPGEGTTFRIELPVKHVETDTETTA